MEIATIFGIIFIIMMILLIFVLVLEDSKNKGDD